MLTNYTKEKLARKKLTEFEEGKIPDQPEIMDQLKMLKPEDLELDDDYSGSDISDPFDVQKSEQIDAELKKARRKMTKLQKDYELMNSFSEEFKKCMEEARKEIEISSNMAYEDMNEVHKVLKAAVHQKHIPETLRTELENIFKDEENLDVESDLDIPDPVVPVKDPNEPPEYDELSGVWNMLKTSKDLLVSPPGYHAHRQMTPHWLDRQGVPWQEMDIAKSKCDQWMKKCPPVRRNDFSRQQKSPY